VYAGTYFKANSRIEPPWKPLVADLAFLDPFRSIIFTPSIEDAEFDTSELKRATMYWMSSRMTRLFSLLPRELIYRITTRNNYDRSRLPQLACLFFKIPNNSNKSYMLDEICYRRLPLDNSLDSPTRPWYPFSDEEVLGVMKDSGTCFRPWFWDHQTLEFDTRAHEISKDVIKLFRLDPFTATVTEMELCSMKFSCTQCARGPHGLRGSWREMVSFDSELLPCL
jgi:hypothetical protein